MADTAPKIAGTARDIQAELRSLHAINPLLYAHAGPAADAIQQLQEQRAELLAALERLINEPRVRDAASAGALGQGIYAVASAKREA